MFSKRFFISWLTSSIAMFLLSYSWHGLFLNDYERLQYPEEIFLLFSVIVYLFIGFVLTKGIDFPYLIKKMPRKIFTRGLIAGSFIGILLFIITNVIGVSFSAGFQLKALVFDLTWQLIEQSIGGLVVGLVHYLVFDPKSIFEEFN